MYMPGPTKLPVDILNKIHALTNEKYFEYMEKLRRSSRCISLTGVDQKDCVVDDSAQEELPRSLDEVYSDEKLTKAEAKKQLAPSARSATRLQYSPDHFSLPCKIHTSPAKCLSIVERCRKLLFVS